MTDQQTLAPDTTGTAIVTMDNFNPVTVVSNTEELDRFYAHVKAECDAFVPDLSTAKGRAEVAAMAFKVTKTKTAIDKAGLALTEEWRANTAKVNAARKDSKERFEALTDTVRQPLTDWEKAEYDRVRAVDNFFATIRDLSAVTISDTSADISRRTEELSMMMEDIIPTAFLERVDEAKFKINEACQALDVQYKRVLHAEADALELEKHRQAESDRVNAESARIAADAERQRLADEATAQAEADQRARDAETARVASIAEQARLDAIADEQRKAQDQLDAAQREADAKLAEANEAGQTAMRNDYANRLIQHIKNCGLGFIDDKPYPFPVLIHELTEKVVIDDYLGDRADEARQILAETLKKVRDAYDDQISEEARKRFADARAKNIEHRSGVMKLAKDALMADADIDEDTAKRVIKSIVGGMVPAVTITF